MKDEYDFSNAERGRFFRQDALLVPPVHLDPDVLAFLSARAQARGVPLSMTCEIIEMPRILLTILTRMFKMP